MDGQGNGRVVGKLGDRQIDEAIDLLQQALAVLERQSSTPNKIIGRANLAQAYGLRAARRQGAEAQPDIDRARELFGDAFIDHYSATREWEEREFRKAITDWELDRYMEII